MAISLDGRRTLQQIGRDCAILQANSLERIAVALEALCKAQGVELPSTQPDAPAPASEPEAEGDNGDG